MDRDDGGKFTCKGNELRKVRSFRLTDTTYDAISEAAESLDLSKGDYLEKLNEDGIFSDEDKDEEQDTTDTFNRVLHGLLEDLYDENNLEVGSKDKAAVKRYLQNLLDNLDDVISNH
jgi:hypothetical protein